MNWFNLHRWVVLPLLLLNWSFVVNGVDVFCDQSISGHYMPYTKTCYVNELITLGHGDRLDFVNVINASEITAVKFITSNKMHSNIRSVPREIFDIFPNIEILVLAASIQSISPYDFRSAYNLKELILNNLLVVVSRDAFSTVPTLTNLELNQNRIVAMEDGAFNGLHNLEFLNLADNQLVALGRHTFFGLLQLRFLKLRHNNIALIEEGALALPRLEMLDLSHNQLKSMSDTVFLGVPALAGLSLDHNQLVHIGYSIYDLASLTNIDLSENVIGDINLIEFSQMPSLMSLWLRSSGFNFDTAFSGNGDGAYVSPGQSKLNALDIADNGLEDDKNFKKLAVFKELHNLALEGNNFTCIDFGGLTLRRLFPKLERLQISENKWECECLEGFVQQLKWDDIAAAPTSSNIAKGVRTVDDIECY